MNPKEHDLQLWDGEHLGEIGIALVADDQRELCSVEVLTHVESCETCAELVGHAALLSSELSVALKSSRNEQASASANEHRFPIGLVLAAIIFAMVGMIPSAESMSSAFIEELVRLPTTLTLLLQSSLSVARALSSSTLSGVAALAGAGVLISLGLVVVYGQRSSAPHLNSGVPS